MGSMPDPMDKAKRTRPRQLVSLAEASKLFDVSPKTLRRRIADGSLTGYRLGPRLIKVDLEEVDAILRVIPSAASS